MITIASDVEVMRSATFCEDGGKHPNEKAEKLQSMRENTDKQIDKFQEILLQSNASKREILIHSAAGARGSA